MSRCCVFVQLARAMAGENVRRPSVRLRPVDQMKQGGGVALVGRSRGRESGLQVVIAVGEAEPCLVEIDRVDLRIPEVRFDVAAEDGAVEIQIVVAHERGDRLARAGRAHPGELGRERGGAELLDPGRVHERLVVGADLPFEIGRSVGGPGRSRFHDGVKPGLRRVVHQEPESDAGLVRGDGRPREPAAVDVIEEVIPWPHRRVPPRQVDAPGAILGRMRGLA